MLGLTVTTWLFVGLIKLPLHAKVSEPLPPETLAVKLSVEPLPAHHDVLPDEEMVATGPLLVA